MAFAIQLSQAQNIKADIAAINAAYRKYDKLSLNFELNMFETYQSQRVYYTQKAVVQKNGSSTFQKTDDNECINTPDYSLMVDREEKDIVYAPKKTTFNPADVSITGSVDSVLKFCKSVTFKKISDQMFSYSFVMPDSYPDYNQVIFFFDPQQFLIRKIIFFCEEDDISVDNEKERLSKSRIEISYTNINTNPKFSNQDFSYERYLVKSGNKFLLKPELKNYHLTVLSF